MSAARDITVCECWARDGLQSWPDVISTEDKLSVVNRVIAAGVPEFDLTSFVPPSSAPQFRDADAVLDAVANSDVKTRVLTPNLRGVQRAVETVKRIGGGIDAIGFPISASEPHNIANIRRTHTEHFAQIEQMIDVAHDAGFSAIAAVATSYGCPIIGEVSEDLVFGISDRLVALGVDRIMFSDTTGLADPVRVNAYSTRARSDYPDIGLIAHFHDTRGSGIANTWAAITAGVNCVDACLGGIGGEPSSVEQNHAGETGNVCSEDLVVLMERAGFRTGINVERLIAAGKHAENVLGTPGRSQVQRTGAGLEVRVSA
ncbi:hydroxymethylglutaryl-CoA lyase [Rhodococcus qingshengii]|uniref:hydroxymethylglutaryl-CoA lyase n=1 Tax=Rhodococcus qingshengii TaxID=334542 RepID=UPI00237C86C2|nr:hydroxymethylglutaryl-CoA lyase [Rhodococcus qingshengii]WCT05779.1 hydroxymethylglutaryl-CoA lyase [Rhodococcus qingshengii]